VLLESPLSLTGNEETCPACTRRVTVPYDVIYHAPDEPPLEEWFGFECASCSRQVVARREDAGLLGVCAACLAPLEVPRIGEALTLEPPKPGHDPLHSLHESSETRCPQCENLIPTKAETCPICGRKNT
jgi:hypothetical protein